MSGIQIFLVVGATILLSVLVLNVNRAILNSNDQTSNSEYTIAAVSVGQNLINEISSKSFDATTVSAIVKDSTLFTDPQLLGPETGETYPNYNDVDDFNNYSRTVSPQRGGNFTVSSRVNYVQGGNLRNPVSVRTRIKRVRISVRADVLRDSLLLYYYSSY